MRPDEELPLLFLIEDNPSSLGDWYLTRMLSYGESIRAVIYLVKNLSGGAMIPSTPVCEWLYSYLGPSRVIYARFSDPNWCEEVEREAVARLTGPSATYRFFVSTAFEDYTGAALQLAEHLKAEAIAADRPVADRGWSIRDKAAMRERWNIHFRTRDRERFCVESSCFREVAPALAYARDLLRVAADGIIVKPRGLASSHGVFHVRSEADLAGALRSAFDADFVEQLKVIGVASDGVVVEEYVKGREYSLEVAVQNGDCTLLAIVEKHTAQIGSTHFAEVAHVVPARDLVPAQVETLRELAGLAIEALLLRNCVVHLEVIVSVERIAPVEIGVRPGGDRIPLLLHSHSGLDLIDIHARLTLGMGVCFGQPVLPSSHLFHSALVFAPSRTALEEARRDGWRVLPGQGDCAGRWGCVHARNLAASELDEMLDRYGSLKDPV